MAPRRVGTAEAPPEPPPPSQVEDMLDNLDDDGERTPEARVRRVDPVTRKLALLDVVDAGVVDEPFMRENYGGGDYQVLIYGVRRDNKYGYLETKRYRVDASIPFKGSIRERSMAGAVRVAEPEHRGDGDDADMKMLMKSQILNLVKEQSESRNSSMAMLVNMMNQSADANRQSMQLMMTMITTMMNAMNTVKGGGLGDMKEIIGPLIAGAANRPDATETALKLITAMKGGEAATAGNPLTLFKQFLEIRDMMGGGGGGDGKDENSFMDIVKAVAPEAIGLLRDESKRLTAAAPTGTTTLATPSAPVGTPRLAAPAPRGAPIAAVPVPTPAPAPAPEPAVSAIVDEWTPLEPEVARLAEFATDDKDPEDVAGLVMMFAPADRLAALKQMLEHADLGERMRTRFPVLAPFQDWLEDFLDSLRERMGLPIPEDDGDNNDAQYDGDGLSVVDGVPMPPPSAAAPVPVDPAPTITPAPTSGAVRIPVAPYDAPLAGAGERRANERMVPGGPSL